MNIKSIWAWVIRPFTEESPMSEVDSALAEVTGNVVVIEPVAVAVAAVAPAPVSTDTLKAVLTALGHDLDAVWDDAIALARKAL